MNMHFFSVLVFLLFFSGGVAAQTVSFSATLGGGSQIKVLDNSGDESKVVDLIDLTGETVYGTLTVDLTSPEFYNPTGEGGDAGVGFSNNPISYLEFTVLGRSFSASFLEREKSSSAIGSEMASYGTNLSIMADTDGDSGSNIASGFRYHLDQSFTNEGAPFGSPSSNLEDISSYKDQLGSQGAFNEFFGIVYRDCL